MVKERDSYYDNLKGVLIFLVIFGHILESVPETVVNTHTVVLIIYLFHMPLFTFVSGHFAKKSSRSTGDKVKGIIRVYLISQFIYTIFYMFILNQSKFEVRFFQPQWSLWYLLSLVCWYLLSECIVDTKKWFIGSIVVSVLIGLDPTIGSFGSISRTIYFLPFFVAGYAMDDDWTSIIKKWKWVFMFASVVMMCLVCRNSDRMSVEMLYGYSSYEHLGLGYEGVLLRVFNYVAAFVVGSCVMGFVSKKHQMWTWFGSVSLVAYLVHTGVIKLVLHNMAPITTKMLALTFMLRTLCIVGLITFVFRMLNLIRTKKLN